VHPTCCKLISAHVRPFSRRDTVGFYNAVASSFVSIEGFYGSQFYPFPKAIARPLSSLFPAAAFSIFFLMKKTGPYRNEFIKWPSEVSLESNFFTGTK
jgi:hypothetical protein